MSAKYFSYTLKVNNNSQLHIIKAADIHQAIKRIEEDVIKYKNQGIQVIYENLTEVI